MYITCTFQCAEMYPTVNQATKIAATQSMIPDVHGATTPTTAAVGVGVVNVRVMQRTKIFYSYFVDRLQACRPSKVCRK